MMTASKLVVLVCAVIAVAATSTSATMLTFTHTGNGSGTLNGVPFPASDFVITATADTANRKSFSGGWWIPNTSASIWILGLGNLDILVTTKEFVHLNNRIVGFSQGLMGQGHDLFNGPTNAAFGTWSMLTPISPISGTGTLMQWTQSPQINTTGGILLFNNGTCPTTFKVVPEPATLSLLAIGGFALLRRRR